MGFGSFIKDITGTSGSSTGNLVSSIINPLDLGGIRAGSESEKASEAALSGQQAQLDYLREIDAMPREYRDKALAQLFEAYGGTAEQQQDSIDKAKASPLYAEIMGGQEAGEEAILRQAGATGGLRSGGVQENLYDYNTQLKNKALTAAYGDQMTGLKGLAQIPTYESQIGQSMSDIGTTQAMGITGAAQTQASNTASNINTGMGILSLFI